MSIITRFAPSPTGYLHIGGARTALFNWLFTRHMGGKFLLRIEDTDRVRSTDDAVRAILDGMRWLGLDWDGEPVMQFARSARHAEIARQMLAEGKAYYCYATPEELEEMRERAKAEGRPPVYDGRWRDRDPCDAPKDVKPVIRLKAPQTGETTVNDRVQGTVTVQNSQLDDLVLLRGDGTPTYMLSVVVDDHDMNITHVIRGDDHFTNTFRQIQIYQAMGWELPVFAHIPMIHGPDGGKLSKRHGATSVDLYAEMGYLPEAMRNYLMRLGWSHGDDEIISAEQAIEWFTLEGVGKSPSRFDMAKLDFLNAHYLRLKSDTELMELITTRLEAHIQRPLNDEDKRRLALAMPELKQRAKTLNELAESALFLAQSLPIALTEKAAILLTDSAKANLRDISHLLQKLEDFSRDSIEAVLKNLAAEKGLKLGEIAQPLRAALTGSTQSPSVFLLMEIFGKPETLKRLQIFD